MGNSISNNSPAFAVFQELASTGVGKILVKKNERKTQCIQMAKNRRKGISPPTD